jgi:DNA modification methylase
LVETGLKPQHFLRQIVRASLPFGEGVVLDPFMGSGSTLAAAASLGYESIGLEIDADYFKLAQAAIPRLIELKPEGLVNGSNAYIRC